ncbi:hypothetical protein PG985_006840 [Apiospora marii]|uniref:Uncharacterized protein n=1 Tax=Apiospora marii TaxID=335849 RepID=A0ABR1SFR9_9PEZI
MFGCLRWCFGGRPEDEADKDHDDFAANLEAEHQQISRGIATRLATADAAERIRIRDMLRDGDERWFPSADEKGTVEWEAEEEETKEKEVTTGMEERGRERKKRPEDEGSKSSNTTTGSSRAPQLRVLSPPPMRITTATAPRLEPSMTADLHPVLTDLPDASHFAVGSDDEK